MKHSFLVLKKHIRNEMLWKRFLKPIIQQKYLMELEIVLQTCVIYVFSKFVTCLCFVSIRFSLKLLGYTATVEGEPSASEFGL